MKNHLSKITILFAALISVLLVCCNPSNSYYRIGLSFDDPPSHDVLLLKGDTTVFIPKYKREVLGKYFHYHEGDTVITKLLWNTDYWAAPIIKGHINDYAKNEYYLLVDQKPLDSIWGKKIVIHPDEPERNFIRREYDTTGYGDRREKQLKDSQIHQYWIMVVPTANVYGPFSFDDYLKMKAELGIPETLKLKREKQ